jgi:hypothetical protein
LLTVPVAVLAMAGHSSGRTGPVEVDFGRGAGVKPPQDNLQLFPVNHDLIHLKLLCFTNYQVI